MTFDPSSTPDISRKETTPMRSMPSTRKAGDGGVRAVVFGVGDGELIRELLPLYREVVVIAFSTETLFPEPLPRNVAQFVVHSKNEADQVISMMFSQHAAIAGLEATDFFTGHPCAVDEVVRVGFIRTFYDILAQRPSSQGDDVIDGLQGAFHIAKAAHLLVAAPTPDELPKLSCPVISVCPGPSLAKHLDALRALQHKCLIVCADTALEGLLKAGITPHIVTPLERTTIVVDESFPAAHYPGVIFAGSPAVHHAIAPKFDKHILIPGSDVLFTWMGAKVEQLFFYGQSTGVLSATLATRLTTGQVYLVGHDLCFDDKRSHWGDVHAGVQIGEGTARMPVMGNDGVIKESQYWWVVFQRELVALANETKRLVNVNAHTGDGAEILGTIKAALPDPESLEPFSLPQWPEPCAARAAHMAILLRRLPDDVRKCLLGLSSSQVRIADLNFSKLCPSQNREMLGYICRSILAQFGTQHVAGQDADEAAADCADALRNALHGCLGIFEQMAVVPLCTEEPVCTM